MAYAEFYNLNANIGYPFVTTNTDTFKFADGGELPDELIVDCGFTIGPRLGYDPSVGAVYLQSISRAGDNLSFEFRVRPNDGIERKFTFVRNKDAEFGETDYVEANGGPLYGVGFLATGNVRSAYDGLAPGQTKTLMSYAVPGKLETYEATVEPALVVSSKSQAVLSISVGNLLRLNDGGCDGCGGYPPAIDDKTVKLQDEAYQMVGRLKFRGGYNLAVTASQINNSLSFSAVIGEGLGEVCDRDLVRYVGDIPDQGARCKDYIFTIDGIAPNKAGAFQLEGGGTFVVRPTAPGFIIVNSRLGTQVVCGE